MLARLIRIRRDERGMSLVFVSVAFIALLSATTIAIDVGMFMTARSQAQNSADAGAIAGATALVFNNYSDRSPGGPAVQSAVNTALRNTVQGANVSVTPADVTFPLDPTGLPNRVAVTVYRTSARSNAVTTLMGGFFGLPTADVAATATAEASPANGIGCVKPFTIPDRWVEVRNPPWNSLTSTYDRYYMNGNQAGQLLSPADYYPDANQPNYAGYNMTSDVGTLLTIRAGTGNNVSPSFYFSWSMPGGIGASWYTTNIAQCNPTVAHIGDIMTQEPGNMVGPTNAGVDLLMAQDPNAYWDTYCNCVRGSAFRSSPRVFPIPLYDPEYYQSGVVTGRNVTLRVANWIGFFLVGRNGNDVLGRITPILGVVDTNAGPAPTGAFSRAIRLVE